MLMITNFKHFEAAKAPHPSRWVKRGVGQFGRLIDLHYPLPYNRHVAYLRCCVIWKPNGVSAGTATNGITLPTVLNISTEVFS